LIVCRDTIVASNNHHHHYHDGDVPNWRARTKCRTRPEREGGDRLLARCASRSTKIDSLLSYFLVFFKKKFHLNLWISFSWWRLEKPRKALKFVLVKVNHLVDE
jgi:hypothetical protein